MTTFFTTTDAGQIILPEELKHIFSVGPGVRLRAEITADRIEIVKDIPIVEEGCYEDGVLVLPKLGVRMEVANAIRAERDQRGQNSL